MRFLVETKKDFFEDVGAAGMMLVDGALWFTDEQGRMSIVYAPGTWLTVTPDHDA